MRGGRAFGRAAGWTLMMGLGGALSAATWTVSPEGPHSGLKAVLSAAAPHDSIRVLAGTYAEGTVTIDRPLTLLGVGGPVIDGGAQGHVLVITAPQVTVQGLVITGTLVSNLQDNAGIHVDGVDDVRIVDNELRNCFFAVHLSNVRRALISGNRILGDPATPETRRANGIHLWRCTDAVVQGNLAEHHRDGIYFEFVTGSRIEGNTCRGNLRYGLHFMFSHRDDYTDNEFVDNGAGVAVMFSHSIRMTGNRFLHNRGGSAYGLLLKEINDSELRGNTFTDNTTGLMVDGCNRVHAEGNTFRSNGWALRLFSNATGCTIAGNSFIGNTFDVSTNGDLMLNTLAANYWDRHLGYDLDRDGHGDVPYRPVGFFALLVERIPYAIIFSRSLFVTLLDQAERVIPSLSPAALKDDRPLMRPPHG